MASDSRLRSSGGTRQQEVSETECSSTEKRSDPQPDSLVSLPSELLKDLPEDTRDEIVQRFSAMAVVSHFSGPLPPPDILNQYDKESRQTVVAESVAYRRHRTRSQSIAQILYFVKDILALCFAFALALILITGSIEIIQAGRSVEGLLGIGGTVSVIAGAFVYRDHRRRHDASRHEQNASTQSFSSSWRNAGTEK